MGRAGVAPVAEPRALAGAGSRPGRAERGAGRSGLPEPPGKPRHGQGRAAQRTPGLSRPSRAQMEGAAAPAAGVREVRRGWRRGY